MLLTVFLLLACPRPSAAEFAGSITLGLGVFSVTDTSEIFAFDAEFERTVPFVVGGAMSFWDLSQTLSLEADVQAIRYLGEQTNWEATLAGFLRWRPRDIPGASVAIGNGLSYAGSIPALERAARPDRSRRLLNFVAAEIEGDLNPEGSRAWVLRYHHRSGAFGTFGGVRDASTAFFFGLRFWFD